jgi:hypothetical protein
MFVSRESQQPKWSARPNGHRSVKNIEGMWEDMIKAALEAKETP